MPWGLMGRAAFPDPPDEEDDARSMTSRGLCRPSLRGRPECCQRFTRREDRQACRREVLAVAGDDDRGTRPHGGVVQYGVLEVGKRSASARSMTSRSTAATSKIFAAREPQGGNQPAFAAGGGGTLARQRRRLANTHGQGAGEASTVVRYPADRCSRRRSRRIAPRPPRPCPVSVEGIGRPDADREEPLVAKVQRQSAIDVPTIADLHDCDDQLLVEDLVENAVVPLAEAVLVLSAELLASRGGGVPWRGPRCDGRCACGRGWARPRVPWPRTA